MSYRKVFAAVFLIAIAAGSARAQTVVFDPMDSTRATGITDLEVDSLLYDVTFTPFEPATSVYGSYPGDLDFTTNASGAAAVDAINAALNAASAATVGPTELAEGSRVYVLGFETLEIQNSETVYAWEGTIPNSPQIWSRLPSFSILSYQLDDRVWADFTSLTLEVPEPGSLLLICCGLATCAAFSRSRTA